MELYDELKQNSLIWDLFTRREEYNFKKLDKYGRVSYKTTEQKDILNPLVSKYLLQKGFQIEYKDNKKFAVVLTHDVDDVDISLRHILRAMIPTTDRFLHGSKDILIEKLRKKKLSYVNFDRIIQLEKKYNATSSFYFLASEKDVFGEKYRLEDIQDKMYYILDEDCEVGLHIGYYSFDNIDLIRKEKEKLENITGRKIFGSRNHLLRFKVPQSWEILTKAGFAYDSSFGYHDSIGFRNGMCHPFKPYDLTQEKEIDILEIPIGVIDVTLFSYMNIGAEKSWDLIKNLIDTVEKLNGALTVLWHNWTFSYPVSYAGLFGKEWTSLYEKILKYCYEKNAWMASGKEIYEYYTKNNLLKKTK